MSKEYHLKQSTDKSECIPFNILTYNPGLHSISSIIVIHKHMSILTSSHHCHNISKSVPIIACRCSSNSAAPSFFNPLLSVWISDETLFLVFDILLEMQPHCSQIQFVIWQPRHPMVHLHYISIKC